MSSQRQPVPATPQRSTPCSRPACHSVLLISHHPGSPEALHKDVSYLPLCESEFTVAPSLGSDALVFLERATHDARCDGDVAVVAVQYRQLLCCRGDIGCMAYVRPAAFHANAIVMVGCGFVGVEGMRVAGAVVEGAELRRDFADPWMRLQAGAKQSRDSSVRPAIQMQSNSWRIGHTVKLEF